MIEQLRMELQFTSSYPFLLCLLHFHDLGCRQDWKMNHFKPEPSSRAMEVTLHWEFRPIGQFSSPPQMRNLSQTYGPLMHIQLGEVSLVVFYAEIAKEVVKVHGINFADRPSVLATEMRDHPSMGAQQCVLTSW